MKKGLLNVEIKNVERKEICESKRCCHWSVLHHEYNDSSGWKWKGKTFKRLERSSFGKNSWLFFYFFFCYLFVILLFLRFFNQLEEPLRYFVGVLEVAFHFAFQEFSLCFTSLHFMSDLDRKMGVRKPIILMACIFLRNINYVCIMYGLSITNRFILFQFLWIYIQFDSFTFFVDNSLGRCDIIHFLFNFTFLAFPLYSMRSRHILLRI